MSYIPPHKRHLKTPVRRSPVPDSLITEFRRTFDLKKAKEIVFSRDFRAKLFLTGSDETENKVKLVSFSSDTADYKNGVPLVLLKHNIVKEKETSNIKEILKSVSVDPNVKGSLGWSFGKALSKDGYCLIGVDRIIATTYENQTLRLIVRDVDRYTVRSGRRGVKREVNFILKDINTQLQEDKVERSCVLEMLRDALQTIWEFLSCDDA